MAHRLMQTPQVVNTIVTIRKSQKLIDLDIPEMEGGLSCRFI